MEFIQILGLREVRNGIDREGNPQYKLSDQTFRKYKWHAPDVPTLFKNIDEYIEQIPEKERYNMYFTACLCHDVPKAKEFAKQSVIPIDIDDIDINKAAEYGPLIFKELGLDYGKIGAVYTGNGVQFIIQLGHEWSTKEYFETYRIHYKALCGRINTIMYDNGLIGHADTTVWSANRLLRLPNTKNIKKDKGTKEARILQANIEPVGTDLVTLGQLPILTEEDHIHPKAAMRLPTPDTRAVQEECLFLKYMKKEQENVSEPEWYAMLSIIGRLEYGEQLVHEYSEKHPTYSPHNTDMKTEQACTASGPRTCQNIDTLWSGCKECPHYGKITSPIQIKGPNHISTLETGFWETKIVKNTGEIKRVKPHYDDLCTHYNNLHPHMTIVETGFVYTWTGKHWKQQEPLEIYNFVEREMKPKPEQKHCNEFEAKLKRTNVKHESFLGAQGLVNCNNGIVDVIGDSFSPHSRDIGMPYVLPFNYDTDAKCPQWDEFIDQVTMGRQELKDVLQEFMGYTLSYEEASLGQKALFLIGDGANGKSVFLDVLRRLLGDENHSAVNLMDAVRNNEARNNMNNKIANITEEMPQKALMESSMFKDMVTGGVMQARKLYHGTYNMKVRAKLIMACNEAPRIVDTSSGTRRRLLIIPFEYRVTADKRDPFIVKRLSKEMSGILNWALAGYRRLYENKFQFSEATIISSAANQLRIDSSFVSDFIEERCEVGEEHWALTDELYEEWQSSTTRQLANSITKRRFSSELLSLLSVIMGTDKLNTQVKRLDGKAFRIYPYIKLKDDNEHPY